MLQQEAECDLSFCAGQRGTEAEVSRPSEGEMPIVLPGEIEAVRVGETLGIAIAGGHDRDDGLSFLDRFASRVSTRHLPAQCGAVCWLGLS